MQKGESVQFEEWPKTARLFSEVVITEKADGFCSAIGIEGDRYICQSRSRIITVNNDNHGFAAWVDRMAPAIISILGDGMHFGEWVTKGLKQPKFLLFNTKRWAGLETDFGLSCVTVLYEGKYYKGCVEACLQELEKYGSLVYDAPAEGVCVFWKADQTIKKAFCAGISKHKGNV